VAARAIHFLMKKERIKAKIKRVKQKLLTCLPEKETKLRSKLANLKLMLKEERKLTTLLLFYVYVEPEWSAAEFEDAQKWAFENASLLGITGRLRVAREGFNGTMTGSFKNMRKWCNALRDWKPLVFENVQFKLTDGLPTGQMFPQLKVFPVTELVNYGLEGKQPSLKKGGTHLEPLEFHKKLEEPNTVVIDVRNSYEAEIGHFVPPDGGAKYIDPEMRVSTEFPLWVDQHKKELEGKQIMMFCTGVFCF
jgi:predicted sulfurtransferase